MTADFQRSIFFKNNWGNNMFNKKKDKTNWYQSVAGVVINNGNVLLARHTYGTGNGKLIIPGGYVNINEMPQDALRREFLEETNVTIEPENIIGVRFNMHDWYVVFKAKYISGTAKSDNDENSEVIWLNIEEALKRNDVPALTKTLIQSAINKNSGLSSAPYQSSEKYAPYSLYCK